MSQATDTEKYEFDIELLKQLYDDQVLSVDMLPHSKEEETIVVSYNAIKDTHVTAREIYIALMNLRKRSLLKAKGRNPRQDNFKKKG